MSLKKVWSDPVWSKVIAAGIIAIVSIIFTLVSAKINDTTFQNALLYFFNIKISLWLLVIITISFTYFFKITRKSKTEFRYDDETLKLDKEMFEKIKQLLPQKGSISNIRYFHSQFGFELEQIKDLEEFEDYCKHSDFDFFNPELEKLKQELADKITSFVNSAYFATRNVEGKRRVAPTPEEDKEKNKANTERIDDAAKEAFEKYDELIKLGRKTLKI